MHDPLRDGNDLPALARQLEIELGEALRERDEVRSECKALWVMVDTEKKKTYTALRERDEAREAFFEARKHREQLNSLLASHDACWDEIIAALREREKGDKTCDLDRVLKAIRERDEAREAAENLLDYAHQVLAELEKSANGHPRYELEMNGIREDIARVNWKEAAK